MKTELPASQDVVVSTGTPDPQVDPKIDSRTQVVPFPTEDSSPAEDPPPRSATIPLRAESEVETPGTPDREDEAPRDDERPNPEDSSAPGEEPSVHGAEEEEFEEEVVLEPQAAPFAALPVPLQRALETRGFESLTPVQTAVLEAEAEDRDLQISSQTGSGKTVALGFVLASHLVRRAESQPESTEPRPQGPAALIIVPTRELATQVCSELRWLLAEIPDASVASVTGGTPIFRDRQVLSRGPQVLVGTPGRLLDHVSNGALELGSVRELVLDEADQMLDMGFREELEGILDATPSSRRTHMVSATFPPGILRLAERYQTSPFTIEGTRLGEANRDIEHIGHFVHGHDRYAALVNLLLLADGERTLVFVKQRAEALALAEQLESDGFAALPLSGELAQSQRTRTLAAFRSGGAHVLVATDVAARGLDVPDVTMVVHTAPPMDSQVYTHRSGRTGRAGMRGKSVLFTPPSRRRKVERLMGEAGVRIQWTPVPEAAQVRAELAERDRQALTEGIATGLVEEKHLDHLEHAEALIEEHGAAPLVAALLAERTSRRRAEPRDLENPVKRREPARGERNDRARFEQRDSYGDRRQGFERGHSYQRGAEGRGARRPFGQDSPSNKPWERSRSESRGRGQGPDFAERRGFGHRDREERSHGARDVRARGEGAPGRDHRESGYRDPRPRETEQRPRPQWADEGPGGEGRSPRREFEGRSSWRREDRGGGYGHPTQGDRGGYARSKFESRHNERPGRDRSERGPRRDDGPMVRFFMNWGGNQGANPRRLLAAVCRRGEVQGTDIGSIAIHPNASTFDVRREVAERFEQLASRRDPRDPQTRIRRDRGPMPR